MEDYNLLDEQLESLKEDYLEYIRAAFPLSKEQKAWCKSTKKLLMEHKLLSKAEQKEF